MAFSAPMPGMEEALRPVLRLGGGGELRVKGLDALVERDPLAAHVDDQLVDPSGQDAFLPVEQLG